MTETEYRKLLIDSVRAGEYPEKDALLDLLKISSLRFEKTNAISLILLIATFSFL